MFEMHRVTWFLVVLCSWFVVSVEATPAQPKPVATPPTKQATGTEVDSHVLAESILLQKGVLLLPGTVTDSSTLQHEKRIPRRKTRKNMLIEIPAIMATIVVISGWILHRASDARQMRAALVAESTQVTPALESVIVEAVEVGVDS